jgi:hypothetical protein
LQSAGQRQDGGNRGGEQERRDEATVMPDQPEQGAEIVKGHRALRACGRYAKARGSAMAAA